MFRKEIKAIHVINYLANRARSINLQIGIQRASKLCLIAQGYKLALYHEILFKDKIQILENGAFIEDVYLTKSDFKKYFLPRESFLLDIVLNRYIKKVYFEPSFMTIINKRVWVLGSYDTWYSRFYDSRNKDKSVNLNILRNCFRNIINRSDFEGEYYNYLMNIKKRPQSRPSLNQ